MAVEDESDGLWPALKDGTFRMESTDVAILSIVAARDSGSAKENEFPDSESEVSEMKD